MLNLIPGGQLIKRHIYRMIFGFMCLPVPIILLFWNERNAINQTVVFKEVHSDTVYWAFRLIGFLTLIFCFNRIFSSIKIFMSKIPLSYHEIRNLILFKAFMYALISCFIIVSVCWIYHQPIISLVLTSMAIALVFALLIRRVQKKKLEKAQIPSVKPQQAKDV